MHPAILITIYLILSTIAGLMTEFCLQKWLLPEKAGRIRKFWLIPYIVLSLLPVAGAFLPDSGVKFALQGAGNIWLGFYIYYGWILIDLLILAAIVKLALRRKIGRGYAVPLLGSVILTVVLVSYGMVHAQNTVVNHFDVTVEKSAGETKEMKLVLIADLHMSVNSKLSTIERMVELVNEQNADAIVIAGDIFTSSYGGMRNPDGYAKALRGMKSKYGVFAVYGNHDVEETLFGGFPISPITRAFRTKEMEAFFDSAGFRTLTDELVMLGDSVQLAGRIDGERAGDGTKERMSASELLSGADKNLPILVLQHEPHDFKALKEAGADVALCGHTHNGQIFPGNLIIPFFNENAYGYVNVDGLDTVVTAGVGYYGPPMRIGTNSEVTVVNIHFQ